MESLSEPKTVYVMRLIINGWPDAERFKILENIKGKMQQDSKLIVLDTLLQPAVISGKNEAKDDLVEELGEVPYPLCRAGGVTGNAVQRVDQGVNAALNATERTPREFKALIEKAGLKVESILQPGSHHKIITVTLP